MNLKVYLALCMYALPIGAEDLLRKPAETPGEESGSIFARGHNSKKGADSEEVGALLHAMDPIPNYSIGQTIDVISKKNILGR